MAWRWVYHALRKMNYLGLELLSTNKWLFKYREKLSFVKGSDQSHFMGHVTNTRQARGSIIIFLSNDEAAFEPQSQELIHTISSRVSSNPACGQQSQVGCVPTLKIWTELNFSRKKKINLKVPSSHTHHWSEVFANSMPCFPAIAYSFYKPDEKKIIDAFYKANSKD